MALHKMMALWADLEPTIAVIYLSSIPWVSPISKISTIGPPAEFPRPPLANSPLDARPHRSKELVRFKRAGEWAAYFEGSQASDWE
jgi:hypothetical protein